MSEMFKRSERFANLPPPKRINHKAIEPDGMSEVINYFANIGEGTAHNRHIMNSTRAVKALMALMRKESATICDELKIVCSDVSEIGDHINRLTKMVTVITEGHRVYINDVYTKLELIENAQLETQDKFEKLLYRMKMQKYIQDCILVCVIGLLGLYMNRFSIM